MMVGEVYIMDPVEVARYYGRGDQLHLAFNFSFLRSPWSAETFGHEIDRFDALVPEEQGWPDHVLSNHDVPRHATRYDHPELGEARARLAAIMLLTLRGTPFLYYGEEIGMRNVSIPADRLQDPLARTLHPNVARDGERTPMQWESGPGAGFTSTEPWLPLAADTDHRNAAAQRQDPASLLNLYRQLIALRRTTPALSRGTYRRLDAPPEVLAYERHHGDSRAFVALNFGDEPARLELPEAQVADGLCSRPASSLPARVGAIELEASEGVVLVVGEVDSGRS